MSEVLVIEPRQFEESVDIVEHLRGSQVRFAQLAHAR